METSGRSITSTRRQSMLRTAFHGVIRDALDADDVIEILANPDGPIWIERAGIGVVSENAIIDSDARDRIIRLVASAMGQPCNKETPIISGELPGSGERFEGLSRLYPSRPVLLYAKLPPRLTRLMIMCPKAHWLRQSQRRSEII